MVEKSKCLSVSIDMPLPGDTPFSSFQAGLCLRKILTYHLEYAIIHQKHRDLYLIESKMGILTLSALLNTLKIPVNGYCYSQRYRS